MSYHRFSNIREIFQGNLNGKLVEGIKSKDFEELKCNCVQASKTNGQCIFKGRCCCSMVVYKATCKGSNKFYIGNTQQKVKKRLDQHIGNVCNLVNKGITLDSFARHFATRWKSTKTIKRKDVRNLIDVDILWSGNPISCMKSFGTPRVLCV